MRDAILWRVIWKEYRLQRALWLVIAAAAFLLPAVTLLVSPSSLQPFNLFGIAMVMPVIYALGSGAMLFAAERETETYEFQRSLPVTAGRLAAGKAIYSLGSAVTMLVLAWLVGWALSGFQSPKPAEQAWLWLSTTLALLEVFAWTVFFSLVLHRVLYAAILGPAAAFFLGPTLAYLLSRLSPSLLRAIGDDYFATVPFRVLFTVLVLGADVWLACRWFRDARSWHAAADREAPTAARAGAEFATQAASRSSGRAFLYLLWHAWHQTRGTMAMILIVAALLSAWLTIAFTPAPIGPGSVDALARPWLLLVLVATLAGSCLFWSDQSGESFRYFAERGVHPRRVWLSRQCLGVAAVAAWAAVASVFLAVQTQIVGSHFHLDLIEEGWAVPPGYRISHEAVVLVSGVGGLSVLCYCVGQLWSLLMLRGVVALFLGLVSSYLLSMWAILMRVAEVPLWFSVLPIPLVLLWASWLRAPDWVLERTTWRARLRLLGSLLLPLLAVVLAVVGFRAWQIPVVNPQLPLAGFQAPPSREAVGTALMYGEAAAAMLAVDERPGADPGAATPKGTSPLAEDEAQAMGERSVAQPAGDGRQAAGVQQFLAASRRAECWFATGREANQQAAQGVPASHVQAAFLATQRLPAMGDHLLAEAQRLQDKGRLDGAWELYAGLLRAAEQLNRRADYVQLSASQALEIKVLERLPQWAAAAQNTPDRVAAALQTLEALPGTQSPDAIPPGLSSLMDQYIGARELLDFSARAWKSNSVARRELRYIRVAAALMPWEHGRVTRLLNAKADYEWRRLQWSWRVATDEPRGAAHTGFHTHRSLPRFMRKPWDERLAGWVRTTPLPPLFNPEIVESNMLLATQRRVAQLQMRLILHRWRHGALPQELQEVSRSGVDLTLVDPYTRQRFLYRPQGVPYTIFTQRPGPRDWAVRAPSLEVPANTAFLASAGPGLNYGWGSAPNELSPVEPAISGFSYHLPDAPAMQRREVVSEAELWLRGWCFPIPSAP